MTPALGSRSGFALPLTIFVVTIVTLMLSAVFVRVQVDRRIAESAGDAAVALAVAQSGLESYFASSTGARPPDGDSVRINVTGGYANVVAHLVREPPDPFANWTYVVRSTGVVIEPTMGADPRARRTVAQFAEWQTGRMNVLAAFTAPNGLRHDNNGPVEIRGYDDNACSGPDVYGLRVPTGYNGVSSNISGWPEPLLEADRGDSVAALTQIDWAATIGGGMKPDYTTFTPASNWGVTIVTGDLTIQNSGGTGILIVTGDLQLAGFFAYWFGIVLVGGEIDFAATLNNYIEGVAVSGLNEQLRGNPRRGTIGSTGTSTRIYYNSRNVDQALQALTGFQPIEGGWVDNWGSY